MGHLHLLLKLQIQSCFPIISNMWNIILRKVIKLCCRHVYEKVILIRRLLNSTMIFHNIELLIFVKKTIHNLSQNCFHHHMQDATSSSNMNSCSINFLTDFSLFEPQNFQSLLHFPTVLRLKHNFSQSCQCLVDYPLNDPWHSKWFLEIISIDDHFTRFLIVPYIYMYDDAAHFIARYTYSQKYCWAYILVFIINIQTKLTN